MGSSKENGSPLFFVNGDMLDPDAFAIQRFYRSQERDIKPIDSNFIKCYKNIEKTKKKVIVVVSYPEQRTKNSSDSN